VLSFVVIDGTGTGQHVDFSKGWWQYVFIVTVLSWILLIIGDLYIFWKQWTASCVILT